MNICNVFLCLISNVTYVCVQDLKCDVMLYVSDIVEGDLIQFVRM